MKSIRVKSEKRQWTEAIITMICIIGIMIISSWAAAVFAPSYSGW